MQKGLLKTFGTCPPQISGGRVPKKKHKNIITHQYAVKASDFYVRVTYMLCFLGPKSQFFFQPKGGQRMHKLHIEGKGEWLLAMRVFG